MTELRRLRGWNGATLAADVIGEPDAPPVVLLAGGGQTRHSWGGTARRLAQRGWRAYAVDQRGHGDSDWPADTYSFDAFSGDAREIALGLDRPAMIGASLGGIAALLAIAEADEAVGSALGDGRRGASPRGEGVGANPRVHAVSHRGRLRIAGGGR